jgi:sec-independent protein translocase protein TatA
MPFGFHWFEILIVIGFGMLIFGPKRLPELGSSIGKTIKEFQKSMREVSTPEPVTPPPALPASQAQQLPAPSAPATTTTATTTSASAPAEMVSQGKVD